MIHTRSVVSAKPFTALIPTPRVIFVMVIVLQIAISAVGTATIFAKYVAHFIAKTQIQTVKYAMGTAMMNVAFAALLIAKTPIRGAEFAMDIAMMNVMFAVRLIAKIPIQVAISVAEAIAKQNALSAGTCIVPLIAEYVEGSIVPTKIRPVKYVTGIVMPLPVTIARGAIVHMGLMCMSRHRVGRAVLTMMA